MYDIIIVLCSVLCLCVYRSRLESLSKTLKRVKTESSREIEVLEQGTCINKPSILHHSQ